MEWICIVNLSNPDGLCKFVPPRVRTGSWMGPPQGGRAARVGPSSIVILARDEVSHRAGWRKGTQGEGVRVFRPDLSTIFIENWQLLKGLPTKY